MELHAFEVGDVVKTGEPSVGVSRKSLPASGRVRFRLVVVDEKGRESEPAEVVVSLLGTKEPF